MTESISDSVDWTDLTSHFDNIKNSDIFVSNCCYCEMPAMELDVKGIFDEYRGWLFTTKCKKGFGCDLKPSKINGADLRSYQTGNTLQNGIL